MCAADPPWKLFLNFPYLKVKLMSLLCIYCEFELEELGSAYLPRSRLEKQGSQIKFM